MLRVYSFTIAGATIIEILAPTLAFAFAELDERHPGAAITFVTIVGG